MVSKTRQQRQKNKAKLAANHGVMPAVVPSERKSVQLKKTRPNMKGKQKVRLGLESPIDIYEGFDEKKGVLWKCQVCGKTSRVVGFCLECSTGVKAKEHSGPMMSRDGAAASKRIASKVSGETGATKKSAASASGKKAPLQSTKKKLKFKKKH
mmetsp:Transcript_56786/g.65060  ORF Transcript_56786/g.65060 Transcript_56786/m.65060 type:complete len:153 (+) Transcript_56786:39-497(+)